MGNETQAKKKITILSGYLIFSFVLVLLDQWTKFLAAEHLKGQADIPLIKNVFELSYLENTGMAWGLFAGGRWAFLAGTLLVLALIFYLLIKAPLTKRYQPLRIILTVLAAGAVGNLIDRLVHGYVVDFFSFCLIHFPIFNVADCYVVISGILFVLFFLFYYKDEDLVYLVPSFFNRKKDKGDLQP
ncbi:MAG: signal peptidase II [Lachnospiraceae bacterium]|nr:signal peptidase II [Lachnospiraceae bacterium]